MKCLASFLVLTSLFCGVLRANELVDYENPVGTSAEDEVKSLPALNEAVTFRQYSGYLKADKNGKKFLHYWFVEATEDPANKPVLLWLNGGPGCSSMEGMFSELGPFQINSDATELSLRKYSWNKLANVIFLESPAGVGYSYSKYLINSETDDSTAQANYLALKSFYEKFPQYRKNSLYLSGESYAGVYLPTLGVLVDADKQFNLKGIAIGNGYLNAEKLQDSLVFFAYYHGFLGKTFWDKISSRCCDGKPPARESCDFTGLYCSNYIRYELHKFSSLPGFNPYNIYGDCPNVSSLNSSRLTRSEVDSLLHKVAWQHRLNKTNKPFEVLRHDLTKGVTEKPPCFDGDNLIKYMNLPNVREAIHVPKRLGRWDICSSTLRYALKYPIRPEGLAPQIEQLIKSDRKLALLVFNGDTDAVCNSIGDEWFVDDLGRKVIADYAPWKVDKQVAGWVKHYDGITYATVRGSGHMVPEYRPKEAFRMISIVLNSTNHNVML